MGWTSDDILEANPAGPDHERSWVAALVATGQAHLPTLAGIADELEAREQNHAAGIFQLPYPVRFPDGFHRLDALEEQGLHADLAFTLFELGFEAANRVRLAPVSTDRRPHGPVITQVAALVPIWGQRRRFHDKYLHHVERATPGNPMIIAQRDSWHQNRPQFLGEYERLLAGSLARQILAGLRTLLPAYAISAINEAPVPEQLYSFVAMTAPGRLIRTEATRSVVEAILRQAGRELPPVQDYEVVKRAMQVRHRRFGRFEAQLFALERLCSEGESALALTGSFSLLEWAIKALLVASGGKWSGWLEIQAHPSLTFLTPQHWTIIHQIKTLRNQQVHEAPPARQSIALPARTAGRQADEFGGDDIPGKVRAGLTLAFEVFREANRRGISIDEFKIPPSAKSSKS